MRRKLQVALNLGRKFRNLERMKVIVVYPNKSRINFLHVKVHKEFFLEVNRILCKWFTSLDLYYFVLTTLLKIAMLLQLIASYGKTNEIIEIDDCNGISNSSSMLILL